MTVTMPRPAQPLAHTPSPHARLDADISHLQERKHEWIRTPIERKIDYLWGIVRKTLSTASDQVDLAARAKGYSKDSPMIAEDWIAGPYIQIRFARLLAESLQQIRDSGRVEIDPSAVRTLDSGQLSVQVFPLTWIDRALFTGSRAEVWMEPGVTRENLAENMGAIYRQPDHSGRVSLILGAGNVSSIPFLDALSKLFIDGEVALLKFNPVNDYLGPCFEEVFDELIQDGFLQTAFGGADVGSYLCNHPGIEAVHITGSAKTHDAIVFGAGPEGAARKARSEPIFDKPITSELGNVSPVILVPGRWSDSDIRFQAENVATQMVQNGGFNCNAAKVLVTHRDWPQRRQFLDTVLEVLGELPERHAYYPGADQRHAQFLEAYPQARLAGDPAPGRVTPTLIPDLDPTEEDQLAFTVESFFALAGETALGGIDAATFLNEAVRFCNHTLTGTLNACIVIHPRSRRELGDKLEKAVQDLEYGAVAINHWPAISYALGTTTWGAYPGSTLTDVRSGIGTVHNALLFDRPQKSFADGPFRIFPKPPWFVTHRNAHRIAPLLASLESSPSFRKLPRILLQALRS